MLQTAAARVLSVLAAFLALISGAAAWGESAPFDLSGPNLEAKVTREKKTLPISAVPNLEAGDGLWIKADLPATQSERYLMVVAFLRGNYLGVARRNLKSTPTVGAAAVNALLAGPSSSEKTAGLSSAVPPGSALVGLSILSGTATANFNSSYATPGSPASELQRVAEVVFTRADIVRSGLVQEIVQRYEV